jgi:hypothetical protein
MPQRTSSEHLATRSSTSLSASFTAHGAPLSPSATPTNEEDRPTALLPRALIPSAPSALATVGNSLSVSYHLPTAARPGASHAVPLGNTPGTLSPVFTAASGERVRFSQVEGQWRAAMQARDGSTALHCTLPVVSSEDIGVLLSGLRPQDVWASRSRIHVMTGPTLPYSPCVYLGKMGLLGGVPSDRAVEWRSGPHIRFSTSNDARTEVYHIPLPEGYRYWGYRERPGSVVQRASCTIRYVEANSEEEITGLEQCVDEETLEAHLSADFENVVNLGTLSGGGQAGQAHGRHGGHSSRFTHAALVVYMSTKQNRLFKKESRVDVQLEIGIERVRLDPPTSQSPVVDSVPFVPIPILDPAPQAPAQPFVPTSVRPSFVATHAPQSPHVERELRARPAALEAQQLEVLRKEEERLEEEARQKQSEDRLEEELQKRLKAFREARLKEEVRVVSFASFVPISIPDPTPQAPAQPFVPTPVRPFVAAPTPQSPHVEPELSEELARLKEEKRRKEKEKRQKQAGGQVQIAQPSAREATKKVGLVKTAIPSIAFGPQEWNKYYGEVGVAPPLPTDIEATLSASCPFWPDRKVRDTHLLALLPVTVDGKPFTLNLLKELIQRPKNGGHGTKYDRYYDASAVKAQIGNNPSDCSYWLLMTRDVLPESRGKTHEAQKKLVAAHASRTGLPYELPKALEAATAILTHHVRDGEWLYGDDPWTYTCCQEVGDFMYEGKTYRGPAVVGGFESSGLSIDRNESGSC